MRRGRLNHLPLTPEMLRAGYDFLCATAPFKSWNLPDGEDINFVVIKGRDTDARIWFENKRPHIGISSARNGHTITVLSSIAHEVIHLHEDRCKIRHRGANHHSLAFRKWAAEVCAIHGFDPKLFY